MVVYHIGAPRSRAKFSVIGKLPAEAVAVALGKIVPYTRGKGWENIHFKIKFRLFSYFFYELFVDLQKSVGKFLFIHTHAITMA